MTPEQLDEARAREAHGRVNDKSWSTKWEELNPGAREARTLAARLAREGWEPVDPDLIEAREIVAKWLIDERSLGLLAASTRRGDDDHTSQVQCTLAALKRGRELAGQSQ